MKAARIVIGWTRFAGFYLAEVLKSNLHIA